MNRFPSKSYVTAAAAAVLVALAIASSAPIALAQPYAFYEYNYYGVPHEQEYFYDRNQLNM